MFLELAKQLLTQLRMILPYKHNLFYIVLFITLLYLISLSDIYILPLIFYLFFLIKNKKGILILLFGVSLIFIIIFNMPREKIIEDNFYLCIVKQVDKNENTTKIRCKIKNENVLVYTTDHSNIIPGDIYKVFGELKEVETNTFDNGFNYQDYLKSKKIYYTIKASNIIYINHQIDVGIFRHKVLEYIDSLDLLTSGYIKTFILASKDDLNDDVIKSINNLGISHMFAISGLHTGLIIIFLSKLFKKSRFQVIIILVILLFYLLLTNFTASLLRSSLFYLLIVINKKYNKPFDNLDLLSIIFIVLILYNPFYFFDMGFNLSFIVTFSILLSKNILENRSNINQLLTISCLALTISLPITLTFNNSFNLLSVFYNVIYLNFVSFVILPLSYLTLLLPFLDNFFNIIVSFFEETISLFNQIDIFRINLRFNNHIEIIGYYFLIYHLLINQELKRTIRKEVLLIVTLLVIVYNSQLVNFSSEVIFFDVFGDSTLVKDKHDKCNILIDTGESDDYDSVVNALKSKNIHRIDYLIITHFHSDHYFESDDIINNLNVKKIITHQNYPMNINCGNINIVFFQGQHDYHNENNNSLIFSLYIENYHFLFTGDIEEEVEKNFAKNYRLNVDVLKVAHHGSKTSSCDVFLEKTNPKIAIIIAKRGNKFNHPSEETITKLLSRNVTVYRTDTMGSITFKFKEGKLRIYTNPP